jgi:predicted RNase H-like nuclease (RuvC/YqgF family)
VGPEYLALGLTAFISAVGSGSWVANKILSRSHERVRNLHDMLNTQENRLNNLENQLNRLPIDYVLKVDFLREIKEMHDNFKQINLKLDKLMEKLLAK